MSALLSHSPTVADPSQTAGEDMDEDERDDEMPEPTRFTSVEKRKKIQTDENAQELRVPIVASSHASSLRPSDGAQEQLVRFAKQARTTRKGVAMLQDVFFLSRRATGNDSCEDDWHASRQREETSADEGRRKTFPLSILSARRASCPHRDETRGMEKVEELQCSVILSDEEVRQLTEAGREIYPMEWVEVDESAHLRRDSDYVSALANNESRCGWLRKLRDNGRITHRLSSCRCGFAQYRLQLVCTGSRLYSRVRYFTNGYVQGQENDRIQLYRIPEEGIAGYAIFGIDNLQGVSVTTKVEWRGRWALFKLCIRMACGHC